MRTMDPSEVCSACYGGHGLKPWSPYFLRYFVRPPKAQLIHCIPHKPLDDGYVLADGARQSLQEALAITDCSVRGWELLNQDTTVN